MTITALIIAGALVCDVSDNVVNWFKPLEYCYTGGLYHQQLFHYRLLVPRRMVLGERYPLLVLVPRVSRGWGRQQGESSADEGVVAISETTQ